MELDIRKTISILLSKFWLIVSVTIIGGVLFFVFNSFFVTPMYTSEAVLYVTNMSDRKTSIVTSNDVMVSKELVSTAIVIMNSRTVLDKVAEQSGLGYTGSQIKRMLSAGAVSSTEVFKIQVTNADPEKAKIIADTLLEVAPREIERVITAGSITIIDYATLPLSPSSPNVFRNTVIGAFLCMLITMALIVLFEAFDTRIRSEFDIVDNFEFPIIGVVPSFKMVEKAVLLENQKRGS